MRYVECKCLLGGVTTSQGVMLNSNAGIQRFYRGIIRNVEQTDDPALPEAQGRIADVDAKDARNFLTRLKKEDSCFLLHLSEGVTDPSQPDSEARRHFLALEVAPGEWALNDVFTGIHAAGLLPEDFDVLARQHGSMVWSPLSNLLLYGGTARVDAARAAGVNIGLGSDWSPTGSKNLLGELKVAWLYSQHAAQRSVHRAGSGGHGHAGRGPHLEVGTALLGTIAAGERADLLVIDGTAGDPYDALIRAKETDIRLVMINGVARYGVPALMAPLAPEDQTVSVGGQSRRLFLKQETADPDVAVVSLSDRHQPLARRAPQHRQAGEGGGEAEAGSREETRSRRARPSGLVAGAGRDPGPGSRPAARVCHSIGPRDFTGPKRAAATAAAAAPHCRRSCSRSASTH